MTKILADTLFHQGPRALLGQLLSQPQPFGAPALRSLGIAMALTQRGLVGAGISTSELVSGISSLMGARENDLQAASSLAKSIAERLYEVERGSQAVYASAQERALRMAAFFFPPEKVLARTQPAAGLSPDEIFGPMTDVESFDVAQQRYAQRRSDPRRRSLERAIMMELLREGTISYEPRLIFTAGAPGSGKSVTMKALRGAGFLDTDDFLIIDPDAIKERLPEYADFKRLDRTKAASAVHAESADIQTQLFWRAMTLGKNIVVDGTLRATGYFKRLITTARRRNPQYKTSIIFVDAHEQVLLERVASRGQATGRYVPEAFVLDTKRIISESVRKLSKVVDATIDIDNTAKPVIRSFYKDGETVMVDLQVPLKGAEGVWVNYRVAVPTENLASDASFGTTDQIKGNKRVIRIESGPHFDARSLEKNLLEHLAPSDYWVIVKADDPEAKSLLQMAKKMEFETIVVATGQNPGTNLNGLPTFYAVVPDQAALSSMWDDLIRTDEENRVLHLGLDFRKSLDRPLSTIASEIEEERRTSLARLNETLTSRSIRVMETSRLDEEVFKGRTPVLISGASAKSWPLISPDNQAEVTGTIEELLSQLDPSKVVIVTGGTNYGVEKIVHELASKKGFTVLGTFAELATTATQKIGPVTHAVEMGNSWYGKSRPALKMIRDRSGVVVFIGGGEILKNEIKMASDMGVEFYLMQGPEGAANDLAPRYPSRTFLGRNGLLYELMARDPKLFSSQGRVLARETLSYDGLLAKARGLKVRVLGGYSELGYEDENAVRAYLKDQMIKDGDSTLYVMGATVEGIGLTYKWIPQLARELGYQNIKLAGIASRQVLEDGIAPQDYLVLVDTPPGVYEVKVGGHSLMVSIAKDTGGEMIYFKGGRVSQSEVTEALESGIKVTLVASDRIKPDPKRVVAKIIADPTLDTDGTSRFVTEADQYPTLTIVRD